VTYIVAPCVLPDAAIIAAFSACNPPHGFVAPCPTIIPSETISAPTAGFGNVVPLTDSARESAVCMKTDPEYVINYKSLRT
jgi:hypothetical protein